MPSGDNSFYINGQTSNNNYEEFIGNEILEVMRNMFPLSNKREDTFIAGLSMGGYDAIRNGMKYAQTYSCIIGLSSALPIIDSDFQSFYFFQKKVLRSS